MNLVECRAYLRLLRAIQKPTSALPTSILIMLPNQRGCHHPFSIPEYSAGDDVPRGGVARSIVELSGQGREQVNLRRAS